MSSACPNPRPVFGAWTSSPTWVRVVPFAGFIVLTFLQGKLGDASRYWLYFVKTVAGAGMIWAVRPFVSELRWKLSWEAAAVGVGVFVMWVGLDPYYPTLDGLAAKLGVGKANPAAEQAAAMWNPHAQFGAGSAWAWFFILVRILGSSLVVPPLEEVFYRSFLYRYVTRPDFTSVPLGAFAWLPFLLTSVLFGLAHNEWLAGILCGFAFQGLVSRKKRLDDAIAAHAITNFLLGLWVVSRGAWKYW